ncbi:nucleotide sugar dehydrogenase [Candidatus Pelagibacter sp.]|nr:nucleotide sugar dehydrogenase [Candidatus Pelagibacter sp.]
MNYKKSKIAIIGIGYVGLPLAIEFSKKRKVVAFDLSEKRIKDLINCYDYTFELSTAELKKTNNIKYTNSINDIKKCKIFIITVPTPIKNSKKPDLSFLENATKLVGSILKKNDIVIYESTVYPGVTEEICVPILEASSSLKYNKEFFCGYSPERINPGDKKRPLKSIRKITSGSNSRVAKEVDQLYKEIIKAGTYLAPSIKVAEAAKVIENTQRDVNIALINEFAIVFNKLNLDTHSVLDAASTKWNFLPFKPGLVGGHCIGVDPYYLAYKAKKAGHNPEMIISGRRINDRMSLYVVDRLTKAMKDRKINISNSNVLIMGLTFKENCPDTRNTKVIDIINNLRKLNINLDVCDPLADKKAVSSEFNLRLIDKPLKNKYDGIIIAVAHNQFKSIKFKSLQELCKQRSIIFDLKNIFPNNKKTIKL